MTTNDNLCGYDIENSNIKFNLQPTNDKIEFRIVSLSIEGIYDIYVKS
jgi:hypothetical protein